MVEHKPWSNHRCVIYSDVGVLVHCRDRIAKVHNLSKAQARDIAKAFLLTPAAQHLYTRSAHIANEAIRRTIGITSKN